MKFGSCEIDSQESFNLFLNGLDEDQKNWVMRSSLAFDSSLSRGEFLSLILTFCRQRWKTIILQFKQDPAAAHDYQLMRDLLASLSGR